MAAEKGNLSIQTENILPIIKKWLYSDKDIFIRELVSNAMDAIRKHGRLVELGEDPAEKPISYSITVKMSKKNKTLSFADNGIGMTGEEVKKYITQIAFSGAQDFLEKYKDESVKSQIIGHFGLGFFSAFMVSEKVVIHTRSYQKDALPVKWESDGTSEYTMEDGNRQERGTEVILHIGKEEKEYLDFFKIRATVKKYCGFLPCPIYVLDADEKEKDSTEPVNDTSPLWLKKPAECTDQEYKTFYRNHFRDHADPLFWIHLNMEYPFRLKGILFFPKLRHEFETIEGHIQLYYNQVYVADNIKEVIPEFLLLLKGVVDCPDLPLNVSRSFLQNDGYVKKISDHITKKVSDKLGTLFQKQRDDYNRYWDDIHPFVKYGCIREEKFYDKMKDYLLFRSVDGTHRTLQECLDLNKEKQENKVYYVSDIKRQAQYVALFRELGMDAVVLDMAWDSHFISFLESKHPKVRFLGVDSNIAEVLKGEDTAEGMEGLADYFKKILGKETLSVETESLRSDEVPAILATTELSRRMKEMERMFGGKQLPNEDKILLNTSNPIIRNLSAMEEGPEKEDLARYVYRLALLTAGKLEAEELTEFIRYCNRILGHATDESGKRKEKP